MSEEKNIDYDNVMSLVGTDLWNYMTTLYLIKKYQKHCTFIPIKKSEIFSQSTIEKIMKSKKLEITGLTWRCEQKEIEKECNFTISQMFMFQKEDSDMGDIVKYKSFLKNCINRSERMVIIPLTLSYYDDVMRKKINHSNMLIYDKVTKILERFEPNGSEEFQFDVYFDIEKLDTDLENVFKFLLDDKDIKYEKPIEYLLGPQAMEEIVKKEWGIKEIILKEKRNFGSCSIWSFLYAEMRLKNPDTPREEIIDFLNNKIHQESENIHNFIIKMVHTLGNLLNQIKTSKNKKEIVEYIKTFEIK